MKMLPRMVWLTKPELVLILDAIDYYANEKRKADPEIMGDIREKIVLARYGKIRKSEMPAIRAGKRRPKPPRSRHRKPATKRAANP